MKSSNPYLGSLAKNEGQHPFAQPGMQGQAGYNGFSDNPYATSARGGVQTAAAHHGMQGAANFGAAGAADRPLTIDDIVTKTGITLAVLIVAATINYFTYLANPAAGLGLTFVGMIGGLITVLVSAFSKKYGSPVVTLLYAVFEGLFVGGFSFLMANVTVSGANAGSLIAQAVLGTIGVFIGMLVVYKTGAIRVTPKFTRFLIGAMIGVLVLALGNLVMSFFVEGAGPLRDGGPLAILFSLVCIGIAAMSFLLDFDQADKLVRAGAPSKTAWGVALGLTVTLVWLYLEILRLLSYLQRD